MTNTFKPTITQRLRLLLTAPSLALSPTVPNLTMYGGATITGAHDAAGKQYTVYCARDNRTGRFGLYSDADGEIVLMAPVSGRGSVWVSLFDGLGHWIGWESNTRAGGVLAGFQPFTPIAELERRIAELAGQIVEIQSRLNALPPSIAGGVLRVPAQGGIEGGQITLESGDGSPEVNIDAYGGRLRIHRDGVVLAEWG